jgi:hypothetical protein
MGLETRCHLPFRRPHGTVRCSGGRALRTSPERWISPQLDTSWSLASTWPTYNSNTSRPSLSPIYPVTIRVYAHHRSLYPFISIVAAELNSEEISKTEKTTVTIC